MTHVHCGDGPMLSQSSTDGAIPQIRFSAEIICCILLAGFPGVVSDLILGFFLPSRAD